MKRSDRFALQVATWFGCGRSPVAPGTVGTLGAVPLHFLLCRLHPGLHFAAVGAVSLLGIWSADRAVELLGEKDPQSVVIDEVAGVLIALGMVRNHGIGAKLAAAVLFRVLDITKPGIIDRAQDAKPEGLGVMADDLLAGVMAGLSARWLSAKR